MLFYFDTWCKQVLIFLISIVVRPLITEHYSKKKKEKRKGKKEKKSFYRIHSFSQIFNPKNVFALIFIRNESIILLRMRANKKSIRGEGKAV